MQYNYRTILFAKVFTISKQDEAKIYFKDSGGKSFIASFGWRNATVTKYLNEKGITTDAGSIETAESAKESYFLKIADIDHAIDMVNSSIEGNENYSDKCVIVRLSIDQNLFVVSYKGMLYINQTWTRKAGEDFFHISTNNTSTNRGMYSSSFPHDTMGDGDTNGAGPFNSLQEAEAWVGVKRRGNTNG